MSIGKKIAELRQAFGWSRSHVAKLIGTNSRSIENWETGVSMPSMENVIKICDVFHTTPDSLLDYGAKSVLVIDGISQDDQNMIRVIFQAYWDKTHR